MSYNSIILSVLPNFKPNLKFVFHFQREKRHCLLWSYCSTPHEVLVTVSLQDNISLLFLKSISEKGTLPLYADMNAAHIFTDIFFELNVFNLNHKLFPC
jgi:hypothetical protein